MAITWAPATILNAHWQRGLNSFSTPPTEAEVNASDSYWQVFAGYNLFASRFLTSPTYLSLVTSGASNAPTAACINGLRTAINAMRTTIGASSYSFGSSLVTGWAPKAQVLADLRQSLAFTLDAAYSSGGVWRHQLREHPYNGTTTISSTTTASSSPSQKFGKVSIAGGTGDVIDRFRLGMSFPIPNIAGARTATLHISLTTWSNSLEAFAPVVYCSSTNDVAGTGTWWNNMNTSSPIGTGTYGLSGDQAIALDMSAFMGRSGSTLSLIIGQEWEMLGTGAGSSGNPAQTAAFAWEASGGVSFAPYISFDY